MRSRNILFILLLMLLIAFPAHMLLAQEAANQDQMSSETPSAAYRFDQGDQLYFFDAGPMIPLFIYTPNSTPTMSSGTMYVGGTASMGFEAFMNHRTSFGLEIGYTFAYSIDHTLYTSIPFLCNISYYLSQGELDLPITLGAGAIYNKYDEEFYFGSVVKPELGIIWNFNDNWGIGTDISYWFIPELYFGENADKTAFGNMLSTKITLQYKQ